MDDIFKIEKGIGMPIQPKSKNTRTAYKMVIGDAVFFDSRDEARNLQRALLRIRKHGAVRGYGNRYGCWCVDDPKKAGS